MEASDTYRKYIPHFTVLCCVVCVALFAGANSGAAMENFIFTWIAPGFIELFGGKYWGLITSNFVHIEFFHLLFNLYWFFILGKKIEFESGRPFYLLLFLTAAALSSLVQLSVSDGTGIGLSGVLYAFFGFIYIAGKRSEKYKDFMDAGTAVSLVAWLVLCIVMTQLDIWHIGNGAHIAGLIWGVTVAYSARYGKPVQIASSIAMLAILASSIFWNPFSTTWLSYQATGLHNKEHLDEAVAVYQKILYRDSGNAFAKENLKILEIYKLSEKALNLHRSEQYKEAKEVYLQILAIDSTNTFAKENLRLLENL